MGRTLSYADLYALVTELGESDVPSQWLIHQGSILGYRILKDHERDSWVIKACEVEDLPGSVGFNKENAY